MTLDDLWRQPSAWLSAGGGPAVVVSSRVRLARNLQETTFPGWAEPAECEQVWNRLWPLLKALPPLDAGLSVEMAELPELDRLVLFERHLISRELKERGRGSGLIMAADERVAVMVNEEDHLRLQAMSPGLKLAGLWQVLTRMDDRLQEQVPFAFSPTLGYLTACPTNVGTGLRASVMLHVPALVLLDEIGPIIKGLDKIGLTVRGLWGEGTEAAGNMFQVSNQIRLGEKEEAIIGNLEKIVAEIAEFEQQARGRLMERKEPLAQDHVGRAWGILSHAHLLTSKEALDLLSGLRLGLDLGILKISSDVLDQLLLNIQPGHLQKAVGRKLRPKDRDRELATLVRARLGQGR